jgi:fermentation-respiration switch protein FrsA (DUF1100 family)
VRVPGWLAWAIIAVWTVGLAYYFVDYALYHPLKYPQGEWDARGAVHASDVWLKASDGVKINGWWSESRGSSWATLYLHGNGGNVTHRAARIHEIVAAGSSVLMLDYRGYGKSEGRPSEQGLYRDADAAYAYLLGKGYRPEQLIVHGESLGSAVAIDLVSRKPCAGLVLEAPFSSASDVAGSLVPFIGPLLVRSFDSLPKIRSVRISKFFMQGDRDEVVPLRLGLKLFAAAPEPKTFWTIPGGTHNDILEVAGPEYRRRLEAFYAALPTNSEPRK